MTKSKWLMAVIVILLLANTAVLAMLWLRKKPLPPPPKGGAKEFLIKELGLTQAQQDQFDALRIQHQQQMRDIHEQTRDMKDQLFDLLRSGNVDSAEIKVLTNRIGTREAARDLITFYHFKQLRSLLKAEQQKRFDKIIRQVMRMNGPLGRPPGPPHGDRSEEHDSLGPPPHDRRPPHHDGPPPQ